MGVTEHKLIPVLILCDQNKRLQKQISRHYEATFFVLGIHFA